MNRPLACAICLVAALVAPPLAAQTQHTGLVELAVPDPTGDRQTQGFLWYPTDQIDGETLAHGNAVREAIRVVPDAPPVPGQHPLVVLSHGTFGNARNRAWLAEGLVARGFIVAAVDHPGTSTLQRDAGQRRALWERPRDISRTIDAVLHQPDIGPLVDPARIYMAGHSLGGFAAMVLAGGRFDKARLDEVCATGAAALVCGLFADWQVARTDADRRAMQVDLSDPRIRAFAVFDLGGTPALSRESLAAVARPLLIYGAPRDIHGLDLDTESRALVGAPPAPMVTCLEPPTLSHFDFLGLCTEGALAVLQEEEPDDVYVCTEGRAERKAEHDQIIGEVAAFLGTH